MEKHEKILKTRVVTKIRNSIFHSTLKHNENTNNLVSTLFSFYFWVSDINFLIYTEEKDTLHHCFYFIRPIKMLNEWEKINVLINLKIREIKYVKLTSDMTLIFTIWKMKIMADFTFVQYIYTSWSDNKNCINCSTTIIISVWNNINKIRLHILHYISRIT